MIFFLFFVLPEVNIFLAPFWTGVLAMGFYNAAPAAEILRGGLQAVAKGQWEAAYALSMSPAKRMRRIILPQAIGIMLPPWGNLLIELLKGTALVSLISVADLMFQAKQINASTFLSAQSFGIALVIYYILARFFITPFMRRMERAMARRLGKA